MSSVNVCRLCLAIDGSMSAIAHSIYQDLYEKLTNSPLNTSNKPVVACYICISQLKKCHKMMTRSIRADKLLTDILKSGEVVNRQTIQMLDRKEYKLEDSLCITPIETAEFMVPGHHIGQQIKEEPMMYSEVEIKTEWTNVENIKHENVEYEELGESCNIINEGIVYNDDMTELDGYIIEDSINIEDVKVEELVAMAGVKSEDVPPTFKPDKSNEKNPTTDLEDKPMRARKSGNMKNKYRGSTSSYSDNSDLNEKNICKYCHIDLDSKKSLKKHLEQHITDKYKCIICNRRYSNKSKLLQHEKIHSGRFECPTCHKKFGVKGNLDRHVRTHTKEKRFKCKICERQYFTKSKFDQHSVIHTGEKPFQCKICELKFSYKGSLQTHINEHSEEKPFKCNICQKDFKRKGNLKEHLRSHTGEKKEKRFKCKICERQYFTKSKFDQHSVIHTGEKPFQCKICELKFSYKSSLQTHINEHSEEKPFKCNICQKDFKRKGNLKEHLRSHTGEKPYKCNLCSSPFSHKVSLNRHIIIGHYRTLF